MGRLDVLAVVIEARRRTIGMALPHRVVVAPARRTFSFLYTVWLTVQDSVPNQEPAQQPMRALPAAPPASSQMAAPPAFSLFPFPVRFPVPPPTPMAAPRPADPQDTFAVLQRIEQVRRLNSVQPFLTPSQQLQRNTEEIERHRQLLERLVGLLSNAAAPASSAAPPSLKELDQPRAPSPATERNRNDRSRSRSPARSASRSPNRNASGNNNRSRTPSPSPKARSEYNDEHDEDMVDYSDDVDDEPSENESAPSKESTTTVKSTAAGDDDDGDLVISFNDEDVIVPAAQPEVAKQTDAKSTPVKDRKSKSSSTATAAQCLLCGSSAHGMSECSYDHFVVRYAARMTNEAAPPLRGTR